MKTTRLLVLCIGFLVLASNGNALTYPSTVPAGETAGGEYRTYFDNMFSSQVSCYGAGKVVAGFTSTGVPICQAPSVATSFFLTGQTSGDTIRFNGTNWIRNNVIYNNGTNVGIGTTTPGAKLEVAGQVKITGGTPGAGKVLTSDAAGLATWQNVTATTVTATGIIGGTQHYLPRFGTGGIGLYLSQLFDNGTYVGISNPSPRGRLDVNGQVIALQRFTIANDTGTTTPTWHIDNGSGTDRFRIFRQPNILSAGTELLTIFSGGNVGIGTATPGAKLEVAGQVKITGGTPGAGKVLTSDATGLATWQVPSVGSVTATGITGGTQFYISRFGTGGNGLYASSIYQNGSNIGIGLTTASNQLALSSLGTAALPAITIGNDPNTGWFNPAADTIAVATNGSERIRIASNGNLGIGTTTPGAKLEVAGQVKITGGTPGAGKVLTSDSTGLATWQNVTATTVTATGIIGGSQFYLPKFGTGGNGLYASQIYNNGSSVGIGTATPVTSLDLSGALSQSSNSVREYTNVAMYNESTSSLSGTMQIELPNSWSNTMLRVRIVGYDYASGKGAWEAIVSGYNYSGAPTWVNTSTEIRGNAPFNTVRLAHNGSKNVILLGNTSSIWNYPKIVVREVTAGHSNQHSWGSGWTIGRILSEASITGSVTPPIAPTSPLTLLQGGNSFGTTLLMGSNDSQPIAIETNGVERMRVASGGFVGIGTAAPGAKLEVAGQVKITGGVPAAGKVLTSDATGLATWQVPSVGSMTATGIVGGTQNYVSKFGTGGNGLYASQLFDNGSNIGIGTASPSYKLDVYGNGRFTGNLTVSGNLIVDKLVNRTVTNISVSGAILPDSATPVSYRNLGSDTQRWNNLFLNGQIKIVGGTPGAGKVLTSDSTGLATWSSVLSGATATGIVGGTQNYVPRFGTGGNGLYASAIYQNGSNIAIGTGTASARLTLDSGIANTSGLRLTRLTSASPTYTGAAVGLGIDSAGNLVPVSNGDVVVYDGIGRNGTTPSPNPDVPDRQISYDFNRYFLIPTKQSFVVSDGNGAGYNAPYFKEDGTSGICSWNGAGGSSPYDCATADPVTGLSASPNNSFTMTARGTSYGYQIALGARGDAPLFARSGKWYNSTSNYGSGLYLSDGVTPTPWQKVLTVPANHIEYFYVNIGYNSQLQAISGGGNIGMGTSVPDMRLVLAYSGSTGSTSEMMRIERGLKGADSNMVTAFGTPYLLIGGKENRTNSIQTIGFGYNSGSSYQPAEIGLVTTNTTGNTQGDLVFATRSATTNTAPTERMRIFSNGNVAIGSTTASSKFEIWNNGSSLFHMRGTNNIGIGSGAVRPALTGNADTGLGHEALYSLTTGYSNTAVGHQSMNKATSSYNNSAFGKEAIYNDSDGTWNVAMGYQALRQGTSTDFNTAIGAQALYNLGTGSGNVAVGYNALYGATTTASSNTAIGYQAGSGITTGRNNVMIGYGVQSTSATASNQLNIGNWIYGNGGNIGIGTTTPSEKLHVNGNVLATQYLYTSDKNLKKNVESIKSPLQKVLALNGYSFVWKNTGVQDLGLIAQEVEKIFPELVHTDEVTGLKSVQYGNLVAPIIEAIKSQQSLIQKQNEDIESLREENRALRIRIENIEKRLR